MILPNKYTDKDYIKFLFFYTFFEKFNIVSSNFFNNHLTYIIVKCLLNIHEKSGYHIQSLFFCKYRTINLQDVLVCMEGHFCKKATKSTKLFTLRILMKATAICHSPSFRKSLCLESLETIMQYLQRWKMFHILNRERKVEYSIK